VKFSDIYSLKGSGVTWKDVLLMYVVLALSGNPYIQGKHFQIFLVVASIVPIVYMLRNNQKPVSIGTILIFLFLIGYEFMHSLMYDLDYSLTIFKITLVLLLGKVAAEIFGERFVRVLVKTMVLISLISFVFVLLSYVPGLNTWMYRTFASIFPIPKNWQGLAPVTNLIYTFSWEYFTGEFSYVRNAGIFWESGAFAVFLNITLYLHYSTKKLVKLKDMFDRDAVVLVIAAISTTSTMGIFGVLAVLTFFTFMVNSPAKYVLMVFVAFAFSLAFTRVEFLGKKIQHQLEESGRSNNRFGSAIKDFKDFAERPLLGWSRRNEVIFGTTKFIARTHRPNGLTNQLRSYGIIYFSFYIWLVYLGFSRLYKYHHKHLRVIYPLFGILVLFIVSFSEPIFDLVFLKMLMFVHQIYSGDPHAPKSVRAKEMAFRSDNDLQAVTT
jgi:hypothetical protein